eukprot:scaffold12325_cov110-Isochrysis_galbana.AAC.2
MTSQPPGGAPQSGAEAGCDCVPGGAGEGSDGKGAPDRPKAGEDSSVGGIDVELEGVEGHVHEANISRPHPTTTRTTSDEVVGSRRAGGVATSTEDEHPELRPGDWSRRGGTRHRSWRRSPCAGRRRGG